MTSFHPTDIKLREEHCGHALVLRKAGTPYDRNIFQTGVAAHAVLEAIGKYTNEHGIPTIDTVKEIADKCMSDNCSIGREYDGTPEPPMTLKQFQDGKEIAIKHWLYNSLPQDAMYEMPFAFDKDWNEVDYYSEDAVFRTILDMVTLEEVVDEDGDVTKVATIRDYKTSWHITNEMLDNIQRRAQAVVAYKKFHDADILKMQVFGLRNGKLIEREIYTKAEHELLDRWADDIMLAVSILQRPQTPSPGANCMGCPFTSACQHVSKRVNNHENIIERYVATLAIAKALEPEIKKLTKDANYNTNGGIVGYTKKTKKATDKKALHILWQSWQAQNGDAEGFIQMLSPTATTVKKITRHLSKTGLDCTALEESLLKETTYSSFGIHKT